MEIPEALAWHSLSPEEVLEPAYEELATWNAADAVPVSERAEIMIQHEERAHRWLESNTRILPVSLWLQKQIDTLPVNQSQFAAEALLAVSYISQMRKGYPYNPSREVAHKLAHAAMRIRTGQSAFSKKY